MPARKAARSGHPAMSMAPFTMGSKRTPLSGMSGQTSSAPPMASMTSRRGDAGAAMAFKVVEIPTCNGLLTSSTSRNNSSLRVRTEVWMLCASIWKCCDHCCSSCEVYAIGGDGTMRGAVAIFEEFKHRGLRISITGIPKTMDNNIGIIDRSFEFQIAVEIAQQAITAAHVEAVSAVNGIGLVKLMGRSTGHITLHATLSSRDVGCYLNPEIDFHVEGKGGLFEFLYERIKKKGHAVIVVAEGAGQELIPRTDDQKREQDGLATCRFLPLAFYKVYMQLSVMVKKTTNSNVVSLTFTHFSYSCCIKTIVFSLMAAWPQFLGE